MYPSGYAACLKRPWQEAQWVEYGSLLGSLMMVPDVSIGLQLGFGAFIFSLVIACMTDNYHFSSDGSDLLNAQQKAEILYEDNLVDYDALLKAPFLEVLVFRALILNLLLFWGLRVCIESEGILDLGLGLAEEVAILFSSFIYI